LGHNNTLEIFDAKEYVASNSTLDLMNYFEDYQCGFYDDRDLPAPVDKRVQKTKAKQGEKKENTEQGLMSKLS
jgi:hypothetical protein